MFGTVNPLPNIDPSWNLAPSQPSLVARRQPETGDRHLDVLRWGLLPYFTTDAKAARRPINARAETVSTSGMYRGAFARRRCLVPLHNRMPVVVDPKDWPAWLGEVEADPTTLLEPPTAGTLRAWSVSRVAGAHPSLIAGFNVRGCALLRREAEIARRSTVRHRDGINH